MKEQCRLCLEDCTTVSTTSLEQVEFRRLVSNVFTFALESRLSLPVLVCTLCSNRVIDFSAYSDQVRTNQEWLMSHSEAQQEEDDLFEIVKVEPANQAPLFELESYNEEPIKTEVAAASGTDSMETIGMDNSYENCQMKPNNLDGARFVSRTRKCKKNSSAAGGTTATNASKCQQKRKHEDTRIQEYFQLECEICADKLESFASLQNHFLKKHNTRGYVRCCGKALTRRAELMEHILLHEGSLRCDVCQKNYTCIRSLNLHKLNSHGKAEDKPFKCDKCHQSFSKQHLLTAHLVRHLQKQCEICKKILSSHQALKVHVAQIHGADNNRICATCGKAFRTKRAMERHIEQHLGVDSIEKVQCNICTKWFNGKYNLKKHVRFSHIEKGQEFQCEICLHKYPNTRALMYHKQRVHVEEKFACEFCGKRFKRKIYLKEHIARHTGQPLYSCNLCNASFNSNGNLYAHRRNKHAAECMASRNQAKVLSALSEEMHN